MNVRSFKLIGGMELVASVLQETGRGYMVTNPLVVHVARGPDGQGQLLFAQWSMVQNPDKPIEIFDSGLYGPPAEVLPEIEKSYAEQITGLALPTPPSGRILTG